MFRGDAEKKQSGTFDIIIEFLKKIDEEEDDVTVKIKPQKKLGIIYPPDEKRWEIEQALMNGGYEYEIINTPSFPEREGFRIDYSK